MKLQKNLSIEYSVANTLGSDHTPYHLLSKSHAFEGLDGLDLEVLKQIENSVYQRETLEHIKPTLKLFFWVSGVPELKNWIKIPSYCL